MSGGWSNADDFQLVQGRGAGLSAMATDVHGNVYAGGSAFDSTGVELDVVRRKPSGGGAWETIWVGDTPIVNFGGPAVEPDGDIYASGSGLVMKMTRSAGETAFGVVDEFPNADGGLAIDAGGDVYAVGRSRVQVGVTRKNEPIYSNAWTVWRQAGGAGPFATVDTFVYQGTATYARDVTVVRGGACGGHLRRRREHG